MLIFSCGLIFGWMLTRLLQGLFSVNGGYTIWKMVELSAIKIMAENEQWRAQALTILRLCYEEAGKEEQYKLISNVIEEKHKAIQTLIINNIKGKLPYKVEYESLSEAVQLYKLDLNKLQDRESKDG